MSTESLNPFLQESWKRKTESETKGETYEENAMSLYLDLEHATKPNPELSKTLNQLGNSVLRYALAVHILTHARQEALNTKEIQAADIRQRQSHLRLEDDLNFLSRQFRANGLDNNWRREIGLHEDEVSKWAQTVAAILNANNALKEKGRVASKKPY